MIIETERLILRAIDPERDFESWAKSMADEKTVRYLGSKPMRRVHAWRNMAMVIGHQAICVKVMRLKPHAHPLITHSIPLGGGIHDHPPM